MLCLGSRHRLFYTKTKLFFDTVYFTNPRNPKIKNHLKGGIQKFNALYYVPFYRYAINDPKIGLREVFFSLINKKPRIEPQIGYMPKYGHNDLKGDTLPGNLPPSNAILNEIETLCKVNNIQLHFFLSPYCSKINKVAFVTTLKNRVPALMDLSMGYNDSLFYDCFHLNDIGSKIFTKNLFSAYQKEL